MLYIGYHLGIGYDHDNHYTNFGRSNGGRLVILAPSLTRANLYSAMKQMHFYGSDDPNAKVDFSMNGNMMGSIISGSIYPTFNVTHNDPDAEDADTIKIWKGYKNSGGLWASIVHLANGSNATTFTDMNVVSNTEYYYFAELKQHDGQWIMTSPIWYTPLAPVSVAESGGDLQFNYFPNPVSRKLSVSFGVSDDYTVSIVSIAGVTVMKKEFSGQSITIDLSEFQSGVYSLAVKNKNNSATKRLVIQ